MVAAPAAARVGVCPTGAVGFRLLWSLVPVNSCLSLPDSPYTVCEPLHCIESDRMRCECPMLNGSSDRIDAMPDAQWHLARGSPDRDHAMGDRPSDRSAAAASSNLFLCLKPPPLVHGC